METFYLHGAAVPKPNPPVAGLFVLLPKLKANYETYKNSDLYVINVYICVCMFECYERG